MREGFGRCGVSVNPAFEAEQLWMGTSGAGARRGWFAETITELNLERYL